MTNKFCFKVIVAFGLLAAVLLFLAVKFVPKIVAGPRQIARVWRCKPGRFRLD